MGKLHERWLGILLGTLLMRQAPTAGDDLAGTSGFAGEAVRGRLQQGGRGEWEPMTLGSPIACLFALFSLGSKISQVVPAALAEAQVFTVCHPS